MFVRLAFEQHFQQIVIGFKVQRFTPPPVDGRLPISVRSSLTSGLTPHPRSPSLSASEHGRRRLSDRHLQAEKGVEITHVQW